MCAHHAPQLLNSIKTKEEMVNLLLNYRQESPCMHNSLKRQRSYLRGAMIKCTPEQIDMMCLKT